MFGKRKPSAEELARAERERRNTLVREHRRGRLDWQSTAELVDSWHQAPVLPTLGSAQGSPVADPDAPAEPADEAEPADDA